MMIVAIRVGNNDIEKVNLSSASQCGVEDLYPTAQIEYAMIGYRTIRYNRLEKRNFGRQMRSTSRLMFTTMSQTTSASLE